MADQRRQARARFDKALAARDEGRLTDDQLAWVEEKYGCPIESLETVDFEDAVGDIVERRMNAPMFLEGARRVRQEKPRTEQPPADSPLASEPWRDYLDLHLQRVLRSFGWLRDDARLHLGLRPLTPEAPITRRATAAWLTGGDLPSAEDAADPELLVLSGAKEASLWLAFYIAQQPDSGGQEVLWWRGLMGEEVALTFPASCYPLRNLRDLAVRVAQATGCQQSEAALWLLADVRPSLPGVLGVVSYPALVEAAAALGGEPVVVPPLSWRYVITVNSGLVSSDEVAALYRRARNRDYGLPVDPRARQTIWSAELARYVASRRTRAVPDRQVRGWSELLRGWNALYPQHPYANERAMRSSHRQAIARLTTRGDATAARPEHGDAGHSPARYRCPVCGDWHDLDAGCLWPEQDKDSDDREEPVS